MNRPRPSVHLPTAHTPRRVKATPPATADVAVVGAGLGGLEAAAVLARSGLSVVVLDGHYVAGGCATMFSRLRGDERWSFDVGVHYVGDAGPGGHVPELLAAAGVEVDFLPLDADGFDRIHVPGLSFTLPWTIEAYRERLVDVFPAERAGIDRYVRALAELDGVSREVRRKDGLTPRLLWQLLTAGRLVLQYRDATVKQLLDDCTADPVLRAVLLGQHGDYGVAPSRASAVAHLALAAHFFRGGYYPRGGGQRIADALADAVEEAGGRVCLRRRVEQILVEDGRAVGLRTEAGDVVRARAVVSNADLKRTLLELLPPGALPDAARRRAERWTMAGAVHLLCLGVRGSLAERGMRPGNDWISDTLDVEELYAAVDRHELVPHAVCATSGTVKDPHTVGHAPEGASTLEVMALVPGALAAWGVRPEDVAKRRYKDDPGYRARKAALEDGMLRLVERVLPGVGEDVVLTESATPVTHARYTGASDGTPYGLAAVPSQFQAGRPDATGPLPGLWLCGASTRTAHGVVGALHGGLRAAEAVQRALSARAPSAASPRRTRSRG
jgi:phytoene dehydrogenase-like protein